MINLKEPVHGHLGRRSDTSNSGGAKRKRGCRSNLSMAGPAFDVSASFSCGDKFRTARLGPCTCGLRKSEQALFI
ncbi:hypothetical protein CBR_g36221 [Chara braunii]|uniref:Uncharacterized protein n=1 Tax=Chara braunii TaxID=69332 RepID=A0A388LKA3_CHABU|nr:hypothetical protein CBR_g36221 [Chara braunii]|eukprot:GBG82691.1 hypothetical protein CBR_g36221 [Chara braunii]